MGNAGLVEQLRAGDRAAFAECYGEYADRIFGLCASILRDSDEAADATHDVFVVALQRIGQLRDADRLRPWLFAIARHLCFRRLKERGRAASVAPDEIEIPDVVEEVQAGIDPDEAAALVWTAAGGLTDRDRTLLTLSLNEGLEGADLVAALGIEHANPHSLLHRARARFDAAVSVVLVARLGRRDCDELRGLLSGWDGTLTPPLRKRLGRHVDGCATCQATSARGRKLSALSSLALLAPAARADAMNADELLEIAAHTPISTERWLPDGFPPWLDRAGRHRRLLLVAAAIGIIGVVVIVMAIAAGGGGGSPKPQPQATPPPTDTPRIAVEGITAARGSTTTLSSPSSTTTTVGRSTPTTTRRGSSVNGAGGFPVGPPPNNGGGTGGGGGVVTGPPATARRTPPTTVRHTPPTTAPSPPTTKPPKTTTTLGET